MVIPDSDLFASTNNRTKAGVGDYTNEDHLHELQFLVTEDPEILIKKDSLQKEKQIMVDPTLLRQSSLREASFNVLLQPVATAQNSSPTPPVNPRFISCSLPNSASSSPRFSFNNLKKKWRSEGQDSPRKIDLLARQHSSSKHSLQQVINLRRSRSCAEVKAHEPCDEFDLWFSKSNAAIAKHDNRHHECFNKTKAEKVIHKDGKNMDHQNDEFKCRALCLYLPGFGKGKPVRTRKVEPEIENVISRTVSLEKFECGSWASSAIHEEDGDSTTTNRYFDLPLELLRSSVNDAHSPVTTAFIFDKDRRMVLKHGSTSATARNSHESSRHARFSPSSPTSNPASPASCITPRLRRARQDFNAFLQAQSA